VILLDTHAVLWMALRPDRLSRPATRTIRAAQGRGELAIASVTLMELAQMLATGAIRPADTPQGWLRAFVAETTVATCDLTIEVASVAAHLPESFPRDPFDRIIGATALVERAPLVTADTRIQASGIVPTIW
jgi:PIN domain nuclease of toxin-antitoxin system